MPIRIADVPAEGEAVIRDAVSPLFAEGDPTLAHASAAADEGDTPVIEAAAPHPVYVSGLSDVAGNRLLSAAKHEGWRYLLVQGDRAVGSATVEHRGRRGGVAFSHVTRGPFVDSTVEGIRVAESLAQVKANDYELRLLDVPALYLRTLWLHGGTGDLLIPLEPAPDPVKPYTVYSEAKLIDLLRKPAADRLEYDQADVGG